MRNACRARVRIPVVLLIALIGILPLAAHAQQDCYPINPNAPGPPQYPQRTVAFTPGCVEFDCTFNAVLSDTANIQSYEWSFGDGKPPQTWTGPTIFHSFTGQGTYPVTLTMHYFDGGSPFGTANVQISPMPIYVTYASTTELAGNTGLQVTITLTSTNIQSADDTLWRTNFTFGFGGPNNPSQQLPHEDSGFVGKTVTHTYDTPGVYTISLIVSRYLSPAPGSPPQWENLAMPSKVITVRNGPPQPKFSSSVDPGWQKVIRFNPWDPSDPTTDDAPGGRQVNLEWDYGDGTSDACSSNPCVHLYKQAGTYHATLRATDYFGASATTTHDVVIGNDPPLIGDLTFACSGPSCDFALQSASDDVAVKSMTWDFGDGSIVTRPDGVLTASHTYAAPATYLARVTVSDGTLQTTSALRSVTPSFNAPGPALALFTLPPCRLIDTRSGGTRLRGGVPLTVDATTPPCGIPFSAQAIVGNATVIGPTAAGRHFLPPSTTTSFLNFSATDLARANGFIAPLSLRQAGVKAGTFDVAASLAAGGTIDLAVDVTGYYAADTAATPPARGPFLYQGTQPRRVVDSRTSPPSLSPNLPRLLQTTAYAGIAGAVAANLTAILPTQTGHFLLYPSELATPPSASTLNAAAGAVLGNFSVVGASGRSADDVGLLYVGGSPSARSDFALDVIGYFLPPSLANRKFVPLTPCRAIDTRNPGFQKLRSGLSNQYDLRGNCGVPLEATDVAANLVVIASPADGYLELLGCCAPAGRTAIVNFKAGEVVSNAAIAESNLNLAYTAVTPGNADFIVDVYGYFSRPPIIAGADSIITILDKPVNIDVSANDIEPDPLWANNGLTPTVGRIVNGPAHGMVSILSGTAAANGHSSVLYSPDPGFVGVDTFSYEATTLDNRKAQATVTVTVNPY
ncbi:MAG: protein, alpha-tubulin suppressor [Acidobacteria bacterium]|nr:protein, alpha-tubulin suppressor [Acidobacteriota bacterium]